MPADNEPFLTPITHVHTYNVSAVRHMLWQSCNNSDVDVGMTAMQLRPDVTRSNKQVLIITAHSSVPRSAHV